MIYYATLTFTVSAPSIEDAKENAQILSEEICNLLGMDNFVSEVYRK